MPSVETMLMGYRQRIIDNRGRSERLEKAKILRKANEDSEWKRITSSFEFTDQTVTLAKVQLQSELNYAADSEMDTISFTWREGQDAVEIDTSLLLRLINTRITQTKDWLTEYGFDVMDDSGWFFPIPTASGKAKPRERTVRMRIPKE